MLPRNEVALLDRAFFRKTPEAFQEELLPFPTAQPANRFTMSCQLLVSFKTAGLKTPELHSNPNHHFVPKI
jgi:hypothetical protein